MGKEWLQWAFGSRGSSGSRRSSARKGRMWEEVTSSNGCICAVFSLFDLHPLNQQRPSHHFQSGIVHEGIKSEGMEAPRNSLELDDCANSVSTGVKAEMANLDFPAGIQIRTKMSSPRVSSSGVESPGTKTPTLVARLMGLDLLPESNSPSNSRRRMNSHLQRSSGKDRNFLDGRWGRMFHETGIGSGAWSLPETPRISSARRSDVDQHRLSLQIIDKENVNEETGRVRGRSFRVHARDENMRRRNHSAKNYVKQATDRRFGLEITNTDRRDENLVIPETKSKSLKNFPRYDSWEPVTQFLDKPATNSGSRRSSNSFDNPQSQRLINPLKLKNQIVTPFQEKQQTVTKKTTRTGKHTSSGHKKLPRQASSNDIRNKKAESFIRPAASNKASRKSARTPLFLQVKKNSKQLSDALSWKRSTQLSRNPGHPYSQQTNGCAAAREEYGNYIRTILEHAGIVKNVSCLSLARRHALSRQIDPSIFYYLEFFFHSGGGRTKLSRRCNRKLIFELVNELLGEISCTRFNWIPKASPVAPDSQFPVVEELCKRIDGFPTVNCVVVEDIDSLIDKDLRESMVEEELEGIVREIEGGIVEQLVYETAAAVIVRRGGGEPDRDRQRSRDAIGWV